MTPCLKLYNNISSQKTLSTSRMTSLPLRKTFKNLILTLLIKYYPVKTSNSIKWLSFPLASLDFTKLWPNMWNFLIWWSKFKCRLQRTYKAPEKTSFCSLITSYHGNKITWLKCYGTNSTDSRSKNIKTAKPVKFQWFCWFSYYEAYICNILFWKQIKGKEDYFLYQIIKYYSF